MTKETRRSLLGLGMKSLGVAALAGMGRAAGQTGGASNRVLISIELSGGEDSNNLLVPLDPQGYGQYANGRGALAVSRPGLRPIEAMHQQTTFGVPVEMQEVSALYTMKALAVVANVGDLPYPMTKAQYLANPRVVPDDTLTHSGNSKRTYLSGAMVSPAWAGAAVQQTPEVFKQRLFTFSTSVTSAATSGSWFQGTRRDDPQLLSVMNSIDLRTQFPHSGLGRMLLQAVKLAAAGPMLGLGNQIVNCTMGGWDTHTDTVKRLPSLQIELSQALGAFYSAAQELHVWDNVVAFTTSEFNRQLAPNKIGGSDHGWGGHRLVLGGAVKGGDVYGMFPSLALGGPDDVSGMGTWLPTTSTQQLALTLAGWWGLSPSDLSTAFPGWGMVDLGIFGSSRVAA
jgi:uncharacterized protein (DUF1501 family)